MAYLRLKLEPWLESEMERIARVENRRSLSDVAVALIKQQINARRAADHQVTKLVAAIRTLRRKMTRRLNPERRPHGIRPGRPE